MRPLSIAAAVILAVGLLTGVAIDFLDNDFSFCEAAGAGMIRTPAK